MSDATTLPALGLSFDAHGFLRELRDRVRQTPRYTPGRIQIADLDVEYTDVLSFYMEFKDIFVNRIYHFETRSDAPIIIDGGACIGMATLYFKILHPRARIRSFEPDGQIFRALRRNVEANGLTDVHLAQTALAGGNGTATFIPDGADAGRIADGQAGNVTVRTQPLSDHLDEPVDYLKLNIEGQELPVLREAEAAGKLCNVRNLCVEYHGWPRSEQRLGAILELLDRNGFRYLVSTFDAETCPATRTPCRPAPDTTWFCLIHAARADSYE